MKQVVERLSNIDIFKSLEEVPLSQLKSRKKWRIFCGVNIKSDYIVIFEVNQKARFITKHSKELLELFNKLVEFKGHNFRKKYLLIDKNNICSKSKALLKEYKWKII